MYATRRPVILVAEDDEDDRALIGVALARTAVAPDVRYVADGRELLDYLRHAGAWAAPGAAPRPDFVLLDLNMPRMSGREALRLLKQDASLRCLPVVVFTTSDDPRDVEACYEAGANAFVTKPCTIEGLTRALGSMVGFWLEVATRGALPARG